MVDLAAAFVFSFVAGFSVVIGMMLGRKFSLEKRVIQFGLSASTGVILSVAMLGMLPAAIELGGMWYAALGFILGGLVLMITGTLFPHTYLDEKYEDRLYSILKTGSLVATGLMLYSLPAGLFSGSAFLGSFALGAAASVAIILQNLPRGAAIDAQLSQAGMEGGRKMFLVLLSCGALIFAAVASAAAFGGAIGVIAASCISFSAGAMLFILVDQMIPIVKGGRKMHETAIAIFLGLFVGILLLGIG
jgi:zinc transporter, ZIP family